MARRRALVTSFAPYGAGGGVNPSSLVMERLAGREIGGATVVGRVLPVSLERLAESVEAAVRETDPALVVSLGLFPGEPTIRLERVGINVADFWIPDNEGNLARDVPVAAEATEAHLATLPVRAIEAALLESGIPAHVSYTAGTFLCNATLFSFLSMLQRLGRQIPCGFIHLPYLPEQAAAVLRKMREEKTLELYQRADLASMSLDTMARAIETAIGIGLRVGSGPLK